MERYDQVKLLGLWVSPFVYRIRWALEMKGVEYEYIEETLSSKSHLLLQSNPIYKKVPVIIHGGKAISESLVILEYIDETWKQNPIMPIDPYEKAIVRFWAKIAEEKLLVAMFKVFASKGKAQEDAVKQAKEALDVLEKGVIKDMKFVGGESIQYLDIVLGSTCLWLEALEEIIDIKVLDTLRHPFYSNWIKNFRELCLVKQSLPHKEKVVAYLRNLLSNLGLNGHSYSRVSSILSNKSPLLLESNPNYKKVLFSFVERNLSLLGTMSKICASKGKELRRIGYWMEQAKDALDVLEKRVLKDMNFVGGESIQYSELC